MHDGMITPVYISVAMSFFTLLGLQAEAQTIAPLSQGDSAPQSPVRASDICTGSVFQYLLNPHGEADGLFLVDGTQIHFPPHLSSELTKAVKPGDKVTVVGTRQPSGVVNAWKVENLQTRISIVDNLPPAPRSRVQVSLNPMRVQAPVKALLYGPRGDVNGFLLCDRTIVRMPPETAFRLSNIFKTGQIMSAAGRGTQNAFGRCIEAEAIGTDKQPVLPIYGQ